MDAGGGRRKTTSREVCSECRVPSAVYMSGIETNSKKTKTLITACLYLSEGGVWEENINAMQSSSHTKYLPKQSINRFPTKS